MPIEQFCRIILPHRPAVFAKQKAKSGKATGPAKEHHKNTMDVQTFTYLETHPCELLNRNDDTAGWVVVNTRMPSPLGEAFAQGTAHQLTTTNVELFDTMNNTPPSSCDAHANSNGNERRRRRCRRRCPKCRHGTAKTMASSTTRDIGTADDGLDPWAPVGVIADHSDVFAVGAWTYDNAPPLPHAHDLNDLLL